MPWFKNKRTGLIWEVEGALAERLSSDPDYESVQAPDSETPEQSSGLAEPVGNVAADHQTQASGRFRKKNVEG